MTKPLVRWTLGPSGVTGLEILTESVRRFARCYPQFDRVVCFNHVDRAVIDALEIEADLLAQSGDDVGVPLRIPDVNQEEASGCGWKLSPPRLNQSGHELWLDNDLILFQPIPQIDEWLRADNLGLISEGHPRRRMYGSFDFLVPEEIHACAGLFGLPPGFDFKTEIDRLYGLAGIRPLGGYDEQGLTVSTVLGMDHLMVPLSEIYLSEDHVEFSAGSSKGIHFVGANRKNWHRGWQRYKEIRRSFLMI